MSVFDRDMDNPYAPPQVDLTDAAWSRAPFDDFRGYGGFWRRLLAFVVDYFGCVLIMSTCSLAIQLALVPLKLLEAPDQVRAFTTLGVFLLFVTAGPAVYFAGFESSRWQATPGKMVFGVKVTNLHGGRISFLHAFGRLCAKFLSALPLYVGFLMAAFTARKQALHDILAATLVVKSR